MQYLLVPRDVLDSRNWGRLPDYVAEKAVIIVTGTWEGAELFDRSLAYMVAGALAARGFFPVVMSDEFILNIGRRLEKLVTKKTPFISIGNRSVNAFTALVAGEAGVDPEEYVGIVRWRGTVVGLAYGRDPFGDKDAVYRFLVGYLDEFVDGISEERRSVKLVLWPNAGKDEKAKVLYELLEILRNKLTSELGNVECVICHKRVYNKSERVWDWHHIPYYSIQNGVVKVGYRCPSKPNEPIIVYEISLKELLGEVKEERTRLFE